MKAYETFDLWAADQSPKHRRLISALRKLVNKAAPRLTESVKWGNGCWIGAEWPVIYIYAGEEKLQFGFFGGKYLSDPKKRLIGDGKYVRHIKVGAPGDIDTPAFTRWIKQAAKNEREG